MSPDHFLVVLALLGALGGFLFYMHEQDAPKREENRRWLETMAREDAKREEERKRDPEGAAIERELREREYNATTSEAAFAEGLKAGHDGKDRYANPYLYGYWHTWLDGWEKGKEAKP